MHFITFLWPWVVTALMARTAKSVKRATTHIPIRPFVVTSIIHTSGSTSPLFRLPTWESSLTIFGVEADGDVHINLVHPVDQQGINISLAVKEYKGESQMAANLVRDQVSVVTQESVDLSLNEFTWFSIFRTKQLVTLYNEGATQPFLLYFNNQTINETDFFEFNAFRVSSLRNASWDFIGDKYDSGNETAVVPSGMQSELEGLVDGVASRLHLLEDFYKTRTLNTLEKSNLKVLVSQMNWMKAYLMLLNYYEYTVAGRNITKVTREINSVIYKIDVILELESVRNNATSSNGMLIHGSYGRNETPESEILNPWPEVKNVTPNIISFGTPMSKQRNDMPNNETKPAYLTV